VIHPEYDDMSGGHDLMLLRLKAPARTAPVLALWRKGDERGRL
jgi:hypothetical protein